MLFRQLFDAESSTYTYLLASRMGGEALLIDPVKEHTDEYLELVAELGLKLVIAIDTHTHADHITALGDLGSPRWEAVRPFTHGLRAYRGTQMIKGDSSPELRRAEKEFILALSMDRSFAKCHYNLGIIYQRLRAYESAEAAFRKALEENPDSAEPYYALASVYFDDGNLERAAIFSRKMIEGAR